MRRNKLYTVNKWNQPAFINDRKSNLFLGGGGMGSLSANSPADFWGINTSINSPLPTTLSPQNNQALGAQQYLANQATHKMSNPFSFKEAFGSEGLKAGLKAGAGAAIGAGANLIGGLAGSAISGGMESSAGSAISGIGSSIGGAVSAVNPILGGAISVGSQVLGGLTNRMFGSKLNYENIANVERKNEQLAQNAKAVGSSSTADDLINNWNKTDLSFNFDKGYIGSDGWFSSKAQDKFEELQKQKKAAERSAIHALSTGSGRVDTLQDNDVMSRFAYAFGGPLSFGTGALGIMQQDKYFNTIDNRSAALAGKQPVGGLQPPQQLAFGGELGTNGTDWTNGLLFIDAGGTHEENPLEGVPMGFDPEGIPNLVEEGETIWNDYVFSDRIKVPKEMMKELGLGGNLGKDISFADASKKLGKESEQRPNDTISIDGLNAAMSRLAEVQEAERMKQQMKEYVGLAGYACGGKLNKFDGTNPKGQKMRKGNTGLNTYKFDPIDKFKYWDKDAGDYDEGYRDFIENKLNNDWITRAMSGQYGDMSRYKGANNVNPTVEQAWQLGLDQKNSDWHKAMAAAYDDYLAGIDPVTGVATPSTVVPDETWEPDPYSEGWEARRGISTEPIAAKTAQEGETDKGTKPKSYYTGLRYAPAIGAGIMSLTDALGLTNKPDYTMADRLEAAANTAGYAPNVSHDPIGAYLTYRPMDIWFEQNRLNANSRATDRAILNSGANQGAKMAGLLASGYNDQIASGNLYRQTLEYNDAKRKDVADFNRRTNMFNSQMGLEAAMANAKYRQQASQLGLSGLAQAAALRDSIDARTGAARAANLTNLFNSLGDIGRENMSFNMLNSTSAARNGYWIDKNGEVHYTGSRESKYGGRIRKHK